MTPKKLHRFLIDEIPTTNQWELTDEHIVHQLFSVLKFSVGESFIVFTSGGNDITLTIIDRTKKTIFVQKEGEKENTTLPREVVAAISIAKGATFELVVQKLTEIGVHTIIPLLSSRTVKQSVRLDRLQKISNEALEQSGGNTRVTIHEPMTLQESFEQFPDHTKIVCDAYTNTTPEKLPEKVMVFVGPEGGWDTTDAAFFETQTHYTLSLGTKILRTETAAIISAHTVLWQH